MSTLLAYGREAQNDPKRNGHGWYCCDCGELIGELCDEIERLRAAYDGLTPAQYHAGLSKLWAALGNPPMDGRDVFTRVADEIVGLQAIITAKLHLRRCHDCGHVGRYADSRTPYCLCEQCKSQDTRSVKEEK